MIRKPAPVAESCPKAAKPAPTANPAPAHDAASTPPVSGEHAAPPARDIPPVPAPPTTFGAGTVLDPRWGRIL
ncbi:MAG TPA: hypothetical protein VH253_09065 [Phycisphaerae bacterium]|nr:hypothetical protein [Phycisphaerae bacterium]